MSTVNTKVIFSQLPKGAPTLETLVVDTSSKIDLDGALPEGSVLVKTLALSLDPYLRGRMRDASVESYSPAFALGQPISNFAVISVVKAGEGSRLKVGQKGYTFAPFAAYHVLDAAAQSQVKVLENSEGLPWTTWVGPSGMPGKTAFYGWEKIANAKKGENVFVSSAYGPVGSLVCQLAKRSGCRVIGSAGSDEKVAFLKDQLKIEAFNYKTQDTAEQLKAFGPLDIYWDNVGGATLDAAIGAFGRSGGRSIECGMIGDYNGSDIRPLKNIMQIIGKGILIRGFLVSEFEKDLAERFYNEIPALLADGAFVFKEHIVDGLESVPQAFIDMLSGDNAGKVVIKVADP